LIPVGFGYGDEFFMWGWVWDSETHPRPVPLPSLDMIDLGKMRFFLGIEFLQKAEGIFVCQ